MAVLVAPRVTPRRAALALAPFAALLLLVAASAGDARRAAAEDGYGAIATTALDDLHQYQGQCFPWVRRVLGNATGDWLGYGYIDGYLDGGARQIGLAEARDGDVIQLTDDRDVSPYADYWGLHTAIVLDNHGDGTFRVIDSNSEWDGVVRIRDPYDPYALAGRYANITVRFWRFPGNEGRAPAAPIAISPAEEEQTPREVPLVAGTEAAVRADGDCLRIRDASGLDGARLGCLAEGTVVTVLPGTAESDGYRWQLVQAGDLVGWVADLYLAPVDPTAPTPTPELTSAPIAAPAPPANELDELPTPGPGGLTVGFAGAEDPAQLAGGLGYDVESVSLLHIESQQYLVYVPGAPALVNTLRAGLMGPRSIVTVRRGGEAAGGHMTPTPRAPAPAVGVANPLPAPPAGGLTQGVAGTNDPGALVDAQPFGVATVSLLDVPTQRWLVYVPGAPALVNTLHSGWLAPTSVVTIRRVEGGASVAAPAAPQPTTPTPPGSGPATITYYYCNQGTNAQGIGDGGGFCGVMASGSIVYNGAAACAREFLGQRFRIEGDPTNRVYTCADTGSAVGRENRDIWFADSDAGWEWWQAVGHHAEVTVLS